ncbi:hypothetical protein HY468_05720 [Candidatus Roizmanbacteria bacterium]|nr:hypothetical protein [Candidatus Roizmanbacteria bacterium]
MPRLSPEYPGFLEAPAKDAGGIPSGSIEPQQSHQEQRGLDHESLVARIWEIQENHTARAYFSIVELGDTRVSTVLEKAGIVPPIPESANPFNEDTEERLHEQWWEEHPEGLEEFRRSIDRREEIFGTLYLGAGLQHLTSGKFYHLSDAPSEFTPDELVEFFRQKYETPTVLIEHSLDRLGLLPPLEAMNLLPTIQRPHERPEWDKEQRREWSDESPEYERRIEILKRLHIGALTDCLLDELLPERKSVYSSI